MLPSFGSAYQEGRGDPDLTPPLHPPRVAAEMPGLVAFSDAGEDQRSGVALNVGATAVEIQRFLGSVDLPQTKLTPLLLPRWDSVIAVGGRGHLLSVDPLKCRKYSDSGPTAGSLSVQIGSEARCRLSRRARNLRRFGTSVASLQHIVHDRVLVHSPPLPMTDTADGVPYLVHVPPHLRHLGQERREFGVQLLERVVTAPNATLRKPFRHVPVVERRVVVQPLGASWMMLIGKRWQEGVGSIIDPPCRII